MSLTRRLAGLQYRFYDRMRHPESFEVAAKLGTAVDFEALRGRHYGIVVTFKRSGEPVPTPVLCALEDGKVFFRTEDGIAKLKRIHRDPHVRVGPCNWRAKPLGPLAEGTARILSGEEAEAAQVILRQSYTRPMRVFEGAVDKLPVDVLYVEVTPTAGEAGRESP